MVQDDSCSLSAEQLEAAGIVVIPSDGVFTRTHTAECVFYSVFCFSTMLPWGVGGGQEQLM